MKITPPRPKTLKTTEAAISIIRGNLQFNPKANLNKILKEIKKSRGLSTALKECGYITYQGKNRVWTNPKGVSDAMIAKQIQDHMTRKLQVYKTPAKKKAQLQHLQHLPQDDPEEPDLFDYLAIQERLKALEEGMDTIKATLKIK
jgi:hypothetical protein